MAADLYLGVDGGGSGCRARLSDAAGRRLGEGVGGPANLGLGAEVAWAAIDTATRAAFAAAGLGADARAATQAGIGLAGANVPELARPFLAAPSPFARLTLASDAVIACLGAHGGQEGAILILGTGSQALLYAQGRATTLGGWGFALSDDGSGALLGRAAARLALLAAEDIVEPTALTQALLARLGGDPAAAVAWAARAKPADYAALAPLALEHHARGDAHARALLTESAASVALLLDRLVERGAKRIALMGGLAATHWALAPERLQSCLVDPLGDAMDGALILARRGGLA